MTTVYITTYSNQYPDDGWELGAVYLDEDKAIKAAENRDDNQYGWERYAVIERELVE